MKVAALGTRHTPAGVTSVALRRSAQSASVNGQGEEPMGKEVSGCDRRERVHQTHPSGPARSARTPRNLAGSRLPQEGDCQAWARSRRAETSRDFAPSAAAPRATRVRAAAAGRRGPRGARLPLGPVSLPRPVALRGVQARPPRYRPQS